MNIIDKAKILFDELLSIDDLDTKVTTINAIRTLLHQYSPFKSEPVDCILWINNEHIKQNTYNPNSVASPEMNLLKLSIKADGYTQPIVAWNTAPNNYEIVDGFHRSRVGKEVDVIRERIFGYLPITIINTSRTEKENRIAATIRHNRARGKHEVTAMSEIVVELRKRNWSEARIGKELGMDQDEVLRLAQISGLEEMFKNEKFTEAWEHTGTEIVEEDSIKLDWMGEFVVNSKNIGWNDRSEISSVLYGKVGNHLGFIQKNRFKDNEWFWYAYCQPMKKGRCASRIEAKNVVENETRE